jgi:hypothetical protein
MVPISLFALLTPMWKPAEDPDDRAAALRWCAAFTGRDGGDLRSLRDPLSLHRASPTNRSDVSPPNVSR